MDILTLDFETYYDTEYSLRNMTMVAYIMDGRFQPILMSYALNDEPVKCAVGFKEIKTVLDQFDWSKLVVNAQNTQFDGSILALRFGKTAAYYTDTMAMARVTGAHIFEGASLKAISNVLQRVGYKVPPKGTTVQSAKGMHLYGMYSDKPYLAISTAMDADAVEQGHQLLQQYIQYCNDDVELARNAFKYFSSQITPDEMKFGDMILKCYIKPSTFLDLPTIQQEIARIEERDKNRAEHIANKYFEGSISALRATCRSAKKFTEFLKEQGGVLLSELGVNEDDTEGILYRFAIPERYSEKKGVVEPCYSKSFSKMIDMCDHHDPDVAELFQIKLDMTSSIEMSRAKRFESIAKLNVGFGFPYAVSGAHTHRLGGCFIGSTILLVRNKKNLNFASEFIQMKDLTLDYLVWDGQAFVEHEGLICKGKQRVIAHDGLIGTPDHVVFTHKRQQVTLQYAKDNKIRLQMGYRAFDVVNNKASFSLRTTTDSLFAYYTNIGTRGTKELNFKEIAHFHENCDGEFYVYDILNCGPNHRYVANGRVVHNSGGLNLQNLSSGRKAGQSKALKQSISAPDGHVIIVYDSSQIELRGGAYCANDQEFLDVFRSGGDPYSNLAAVLYGGDPKEIKVNAKKGIEPYAMQRQIAKSAELSCIYGTGPIGFQNYLKVSGIDMSTEECSNIVRQYRASHPIIEAAWAACGRALMGMMAGYDGFFGGPTGRLFYYTGKRMLHGENVPGILMPDGTWLNYRDVRQVDRLMPDGKTKRNTCYTGMKEGRIKDIYTHPSKVFENIVQSFSFAVMKYQALLVNQRYQIILNTHDEWGICVPEAEAEEASEYMQWCMRQVPSWAEGLPVDCEGSAAKRYGDCK